MKLLKRSLGLTGLLVWGAALAMAAPTGSSQVSVNVGAAIPTAANSLDNSNSIGPTTGARYLYQLNSNVSVGGQFDFIHLPGNKQSVGALDLDNVDNVYTGELVGRYSFMPDSSWVPYVHAGVGVARLFQTTRATPNNGNTWNDTGTMETRVTDHESSTGFALSYGGGLERMLTSSLSCALEATWNTLGSSQDRIGTSVFNFPVVGLRFGWLFGK